mgnify:CR=1 FL=1
MAYVFPSVVYIADDVDFVYNTIELMIDLYQQGRTKHFHDSKIKVFDELVYLSH